jgi:hypothetical protein
MSATFIPASSIALRQASEARLRTVRPDFFENSVQPMPEIAYLSRSEYISNPLDQRENAGLRFSLKATSPSVASGSVVA